MIGIYQTEEGGLAGAIPARQRPALATVDPPVEPLDNHFVTILNSQIFYFDNGYFRTRGCIGLMRFFTGCYSRSVANCFSDPPILEHECVRNGFWQSMKMIAEDGPDPSSPCPG